MVYDMYMKACGGTGFWITLAFILLVLRMLGVMELGWIKIWTDATEEAKNVAKPIARFGIFRWGGLPEDENDEVEDLDFYIGIYCFITLMAVFFTVVRMLWQFYGSLRASRDLYEQLLLSVVRAPIRFFDTTPVGRIINRFSKDFEVIDTQMMSKMVSLATDALGIVTIILVVTFVTPTFLIAAALISKPFFVLCLFTSALTWHTRAIFNQFDAVCSIATSHGIRFHWRVLHYCKPRAKAYRICDKVPSLQSLWRDSHRSLHHPRLWC